MSLPPLSCAAILTEPGTSYIPANSRVLNNGISGNQVSDLVIRRDTMNSWTDQLLTGRDRLRDWAQRLGGGQPNGRAALRKCRILYKLTVERPCPKRMGSKGNGQYCGFPSLDAYH